VILAWLVCVLAGPRGLPAQAAIRPRQAIPLFIFAGQSNMLVLNTQAADLTPEQRLPQSQVLFYGPNENGSTLAPLQPPTTSAGGFGPETSTGKTLTTFNQFPLVAEVKFAMSGSNLAHQWDPDSPGSFYHQLFARVEQARQALEAQYPSDEVYVAGFFWMQGEADAQNAGYAAAYQANLGYFIDRVREDTGDPTLPFVLGRIRDWPFPHAAQVRAAQANVAAAKANVGLVNTDFLPIGGDYLHFSSAGTYQLGVLFADAFLRLSLPAAAYLPLVRR
jgi:hypothetical protein